MNTVIIEDDAYTLDMLGAIIGKNFDNITLSGSFVDAESAIAFLKKNHVDLVISDIKLPGLSGLDFAQICKKDYPTINIIFISAYRDFEIARKALNSNVIDYIIKPITFDNISSAINNVCDKNKHRAVSGGFLDPDVISKRQNVFLNMVSPDKNKNFSDTSEFLEALQIPFASEVHNILILRVSVNDFTDYISHIWKHAVENFYNIISNIINENSSESSYGIVVAANKEIIDIMFLSASTDFSLSSKKALSVISFTAKTLKFEYTSQSLLQCLPEDLSMIKTKYNTENVFYYIFNSDSDIEYIQQLIKKCFGTYSSLNSFYQQLYVKAINLLGIESITDIGASHTYDALFNSIISLIDLVSSHNKQKMNDIMSEIKGYIALNYMNNISMSMVAEYVHLSPAYFSRYFKKHTNMTFMYYLNKYRVEKALEILHGTPDVKLSNLGFTVGYDSVSSFYRNFKAFTGVTPSEYIDQMKG